MNNKLYFGQRVIHITMNELIFLILLILPAIGSFAQNAGINADDSAPDPKTMLDVKSTDQGLLIPRMTLTQRDAIVNPPVGLMVFCTDNGIDGALSIYSNTQSINQSINT